MSPRRGARSIGRWNHFQRPIVSLGYPAGFRAGFPSDPGPAGYVYRPGQHYVPGYYTVGDQTRYDFHDDPNGNGRGSTTAQLDATGKETRIQYDTYAMPPRQVSDVIDPSTQPPRLLTATALHNYRVLQPADVTDVNGNETAFRFSPLGLLTEIWSRGSPARNEGDRQRPSLQLSYDFLAFDRSPSDARQPVFVSTLQHMRHDTDTPGPPETREIIA
jgi:hypothetical protein